MTIALSGAGQSLPNPRCCLSEIFLLNLWLSVSWHLTEQCHTPDSNEQPSAPEVIQRKWTGRCPECVFTGKKTYFHLMLILQADCPSPQAKWGKHTTAPHWGSRWFYLWKTVLFILLNLFFPVFLCKRAMSVSVYISRDNLAPLIKNETSRAVLLSAIFIHFIETCSIKNATLVQWRGVKNYVPFKHKKNSNFMGTHSVISNKQNKFQMKNNSKNRLIK